jgi:hypothetical protein
MAAIGMLADFFDACPDFELLVAVGITAILLPL